MRSVILCVLIAMDVVLVACSRPGAQQLLPAESGVPARSVSSLFPDAKMVVRSLYSFGGVKNDGINSYSTLVAVDGALYGTANLGGASGYGTVFRITTDGKETTVHNFSGRDGAYPISGLTYVDGFFYGTTTSGGRIGQGAVYRLDTHGKIKVLYSFKGQNGGDGSFPYGGVILIKGALYGAAFAGGPFGGGIIYRIGPNGTERILHSFSGPDGSGPMSDLIFENNALYGTTISGGLYSGGTVFSIALNGAQKVVHNFGKVPDANGPYTGLVNVNGTMFGTSFGGGAHNDGTVYSVKRSGKETVLYSFDRTTGNGCNPIAGLVLADGLLYGTTSDDQCGNGTIFKTTSGGSEATLHVFRDAKGGIHPWGGLTVIGHKLYGATPMGGDHGGGMAYSASF